MKTRKGFISNSSSTSFILAMGIVKDYDAFMKEIEENNVQINGYNKLAFKKVRDLLENKGWWCEEPKPTEDKLEMVNFMTSVSINIKDLKDDDLVAFLNFQGNEGDGAFWTDDDMNYDIDDNYFEGNKAKTLILFRNSSNLCNVDVSIGAGRNG